MEAALFVLEKFVGPLIGALTVTAIYFSFHIYLYLTKREFGTVHYNLVHFTINDQGRTRRRNASYALNFRSLKYGAPLKEIHRNRFLFWRVIWASLWVRIDRPVIDFGQNEHAMLSPIRGRLLEAFAKEEFKRAAGQTFVETQYLMVLVYDRSEDRRTYVLRAVFIRTEDLENFQWYLDNPPGVGQNWPLVQTIAQMYREGKGSFFKTNVVT